MTVTERAELYASLSTSQNACIIFLYSSTAFKDVYPNYYILKC